MYNNSTNPIDGFKHSVKGRMKQKDYYKPNGMTVKAAIDSNNEDLFTDCVYQAYCDASRKFAGVNVIQQINKETCFSNLGGKLFEYIKKGPPFGKDTDFDELHQSLCDGFIADFNKYGYPKVTIGMAQKVVNLSFKYLYCCNGAGVYSDHFKFCHLTLDDYILSWYTRVVDPKNTISEWSKLKSYSDYIAIQEHTRGYLPKSDWARICGTVLELEFYVFPDEVVVQALLSLRKAINNYSNASHNNPELVNLFTSALDPAKPDTISDFIELF